MNLNRARQVSISLTASLILLCFLLLLFSAGGLRTILTFFTVNATSFWYFGNMLDKQALLIFSSLGVCFAFKVGLFNLGGEGQIYLSAALTAILLENEWDCPPIVQVTCVFCIVILMLFSIGLLIGSLKAQFDIDEIITSFLISLAIIHALDFLILARMKNTSSTLLATQKIAKVFHLRSILPPSTLNISFFVAILLCISNYLFFEKTKTGYRFRISGESTEFAKFAGFANKKTLIIGMASSSAMHALTGFFSILGTYRMCHSNFSNGLGWAAIVIALMAGNNILLLIPSALLYAFLLNAQDALLAKGLIAFDASLFFQAAIFLLISAKLLKR